MNGLTKVSIMDCPCYAISENELEEKLLFFLKNNMFGYSVAINAEKIQKYKTDVTLQKVIDNSILPYPDGAGAVLALKWLNKLESEKINMPIRALEIANKNSLKTFIIGAKESVHNEAINIIKNRYPNLRLVGHMHGYNSEEDIINAVHNDSPELILIAMGSPKQEIFAKKLIDSTQSGIAIGCGGALDIISGRLNRAPEFFINNNLEWLYRLVQEPWRWKRQLFLPVFLLKLLFQRFRKSFQ
tara:strand:- start:4782 stop:5510 length:729 start_codon:yes stop_codon:yes gene_type:complete